MLCHYQKCIISTNEFWNFEIYVKRKAQTPCFVQVTRLWAITNCCERYDANYIFGVKVKVCDGVGKSCIVHCNNRWKHAN